VPETIDRNAYLALCTRSNGDVTGGALGP